MNINQFAKKYKITFNQSELRVYNLGLSKMMKSSDSFHDVNHVKSMLINLDKFLTFHKNIAARLDKKAVVMAICWHDVWKAGRNLHNIFELVMGQVWDGMGSYFLFRKHAGLFGLDKILINKVSYAIRKHSVFQVIPLATLEAKVVRDIDDLEMPSFDRFQKSGRFTIFYKSILARFLYVTYLKLFTGRTLYFEWSKKIFNKNLEKLIRGLSGR